MQSPFQSVFNNVIAVQLSCLVNLTFPNQLLHPVIKERDIFASHLKGLRRSKKLISAAGFIADMLVAQRLPQKAQAFITHFNSSPDLLFRLLLHIRHMLSDGTHTGKTGIAGARAFGHETFVQDQHTCIGMLFLIKIGRREAYNTCSDHDQVPWMQETVSFPIGIAERIAHVVYPTAIG